MVSTCSPEQTFYLSLRLKYLNAYGIFGYFWRCIYMNTRENCSVSRNYVSKANNSNSRYVTIPSQSLRISTECKGRQQNALFRSASMNYFFREALIRISINNMKW